MEKIGNIIWKKVGNNYQTPNSDIGSLTIFSGSGRGLSREEGRGILSAEMIPAVSAATKVP